MLISIFAACFLFGAARADTLTHISTFVWPSKAIVGLSGLEMSDDGSKFYTISDRGWFLSGEFERAYGQITDVNLQKYLPILGNDGLPVAARRVGDWSDAEGLAMAPDGTFWISFERWAHVAQYDSPETQGHWIKDHPGFSIDRDNRQLEALALHPNGLLYTFPERPKSAGFPIYQLDESGWNDVGFIPEKNGFSIVGADFDDDGTLYILERKLVLGLWWQNRVRRLQIDAPQEVEVLWTGERGEYYNLEGIALWHDESGLRITLISDNNSNLSEPTQIVEFRLEE
ncbi:MAG: esterase-like activity of phytase family protein [Paracoccaceae bacterium]